MISDLVVLLAGEHERGLAITVFAVRVSLLLQQHLVMLCSVVSSKE